MKRGDEIVLFGAGDLATELAVLIGDINSSSGNWKIQGFVTEDKAQWGNTIFGMPIIEGVASLKKRNFKGFGAIGVGTPSVAHRILKQVQNEQLDISFPTLIHPSVVADFDNIELGEGVVISAGCLLTTNIQINDFSYLNIGCSIGHGTKIGKFCRVHPQAHVAGGVAMGDFVHIGPGAIIALYKNIGIGAQISLGAIVGTDVDSWNVVAGNPCRVVKHLDPFGTDI